MGIKEEFFRLKEACIKSKGAERIKADQEMEAFFNSIRPEDEAELQAAVSEDFASMKVRTEEEFHAFRVEMEKLVAKGTALGDMELLNKEEKSRYVMLSQAINKWEVTYGKFLLHKN